MKKVSYKLIVLLFIGAFYANAQEKKYHKEFKVASDVVIDVNTRHADIEIETWNKNKVVIEAFITIEGAELTEQVKEDFYKEWDFKVTENDKNILIKSRTGSHINVSSFNFDNIDYEAFTYPLANFSIGSLNVLDSIDFLEPLVFSGFPELPMPELPSEFDFEAYKKDKVYLEEWKEENKDFIDKGTTFKIGEDSIIIKSEDKIISLNGLVNKEGYIRKQKAKYIKEVRAHRLRLLAERKKEMLEKRKELLNIKRYTRETKRKKIDSIRNYRAKRVEIQKILRERSKLKIKKLIKIKVPKTAKLNMDVKYGTLSFAK